MTPPLPPSIALDLIDAILGMAIPGYERLCRDATCGNCRRCTGRANGEALKATQGREYYSRIGKLGGRPRDLSLAEIRELKAKGQQS
jgi:hypothetical protein